MARPSKLTPETQKRIIDAIELGLPPEAAAAHAGIACSTFYKWTARGREEDDGPYAELVEALKSAEHKGEGSLALLVRRAAEVDWKAAMTYLERRWPQRWARRMYRPDDLGTERITVQFIKPAIDPDAKGDDLVVVGDLDEHNEGKNGNGSNGNGESE